MGVWWNEATRKQATDLTASGHIKWLWSPWVWLTVLSALAISALTAYVYVFVYPAHFVIFTDQSGWGGFVDYVGVALGPVFSLGALVGVLYSIFLQRELIQHLEKQPSLEELQRILAGISKIIDDILNKPMTVQNEFGLIGDGQSTVLWLLDFACAAAERLKRNTDAGRQDIESQKYIVTVKEFLEMESEIIVRELRQIVWCLGGYQRAGGSERSAAALSKHWALPCAQCLRSRGAFFAPTVLRLGNATMTLRWVPYPAIGGFLPSRCSPWLGGCSTVLQTPPSHCSDVSS